MNRLIQVFRVGTHTDSAGVERTFSAEDLRAIADKFDPEKGAAPIVKGHPKTDDPAFGWIERFLFEAASGILYAVPKEVDPTFMAEVSAGRFRRVSIALYSPDSPHNPMPGMYYPRHVGFLGAAAPAVKGLKAANFHDDNEGFLMFDLNDDKQTGKFSEAIANAFATALVKIGFKPAVEPPKGDPGDPKATAEYQALEAQRVEIEQKLEAEQKARADLEAKQARQDIAAFTDKLADEGRLTPNEATRITEVLFALDGAAEIEFTEGEGDKAQKVKAKPIDMLRDVLKGLPKRIHFSEFSGKDKDGLSNIGFDAPPDAQVAAGKMGLHRRATAYMAEHQGVDYLSAVSIVERGLN